MRCNIGKHFPYQPQCKLPHFETPPAVSQHHLTQTSPLSWKLTYSSTKRYKYQRLTISISRCTILLKSWLWVLPARMVKFWDRVIYLKMLQTRNSPFGPRQANSVLIAYASSEGSGEPAHPRSPARTSAARSYKQWVKKNLQTESQIPGPSEWLGMRS